MFLISELLICFCLFPVAITQGGAIQLANNGTDGVQGLQTLTMTNAAATQPGTTILQYAQTTDGQQILVPSNQVVVQGRIRTFLKIDSRLMLYLFIHWIVHSFIYEIVKVLVTRIGEAFLPVLQIKSVGIWGIALKQARAISIHIFFWHKYVNLRENRNANIIHTYTEINSEFIGGHSW